MRQTVSAVSVFHRRPTYEFWVFARDKLHVVCGNIRTLGMPTYSLAVLLCITTAGRRTLQMLPRPVREPLTRVSK